MENKKPFWETKIGKIIGGAKEILPNNGVLGVLKNLIDADDTLSAEEKKEAHSHLKDLYEIEVADRDSARDREARIKEANGNDYMMTITGIIGLLVFVFVAYVIVYMPEVAESNSFMRFEGMIEGVIIGNIFAYYYGTSSKK